jgi:hypothetical protein
MAAVSALERSLHDLSSSAVQRDDDQLWADVESTSRILANALRSKDGPGECQRYGCLLNLTFPQPLVVDNHVLLGHSSLPQTIKLLLTAALKDAPIPTDTKAAAVLEVIRVAANFCIDNSESQQSL